MTEARAPSHQFTLFGVPVRVEPWFFIIPALALQSRDLAGAAVWTALVFTGILIHELGHAVAMKRFGFAPFIQLHALGGATHYPPTANVSPRQHFFITLAGPLSGLSLGLVAWLAREFVPGQSPLFATALADAVWINVGWSVVNLLPILPWDGGYVLDAGLRWLTGKVFHRVVGTVSMVGGIAIVAFAVTQRSLLIGYFGAMGVVQGLGRWNQAARGE